MTGTRALYGHFTRIFKTLFIFTVDDKTVVHILEITSLVCTVLLINASQHCGVALLRSYYVLHHIFANTKTVSVPVGCNALNSFFVENVPFDIFQSSHRHPARSQRDVFRFPTARPDSFVSFVNGKNLNILQNQKKKKSITHSNPFGLA